MGFGDGSGISWTICKQSAPRSRQITTPTPHCSVFYGRMLFLTPNQQCQSTELTEGKYIQSYMQCDHKTYLIPRVIATQAPHTRLVCCGSETV